MKPLKLQIKRKTLVPTKNAIVHQFRSDWKMVGKIDYEDSKLLIKNIDGRGFIETDAQFARWLFESFGPGIYFVLAWCKGREGFYNFMKVECMPTRYVRLAKEFNRAEAERRELATDYKRMRKRLALTSDEHERDEIKDELDRVEGDQEFNKIISDIEKPDKSGPYPYLRSKQPVYKEHEYDELFPRQQEEASATESYGGIW